MRCAIAIAFIATSWGLPPANVAATDPIRAIEGVYKVRRPVPMVDRASPTGWSQETLEDVVEIVRYDATHIYMRAELSFTNGHRCSIYGIAALERESFVYRSTEKPIGNGPACTLTVSTSPAELKLTDRLNADGESTCRDYCGARGTLSDYRITRAVRRPIRYMPRLEASHEYAAAVAEFTHRQ
jgi:hypothetical protein